MSKRAKRLLALILLLVIAAAGIFAYDRWLLPVLLREEARQAQVIRQSGLEAPRPGAAAAQDAETPGVAILVTVIHGDGRQNDFSIATRELNLRRVLEQEGLIAGVESDQGLYVLTVDGETADTSLQQWWRLTRDGELSPTAVDNTMISGGEHFVYTLITGWSAAGSQTSDAVTITLTVVHGDESEKVFTITTTEKTLRAALEQQGLIEGTEGDYGLYLQTVDGESVHESHHDWWQLTRNGELSELGVDHILISNGDRYELTFIKGKY